MSMSIPMGIVEQDSVCVCVRVYDLVDTIYLHTLWNKPLAGLKLAALLSFFNKNSKKVQQCSIQ